MTEAVTVWLIMQSNLTGSNKILSILLSIVAVVLFVAVLEIGGRRFIQVLTRVVIWRRFSNVWYVILSIIISIVTIVLFYLSINLSTKGTDYAFTHTNQIEAFDRSKDQQYHSGQIKSITADYDQRRANIEKRFLSSKDATGGAFDAKINEVLNTVASFDRKAINGQRWAKSHADKHRKAAASLSSQRAAKIETINQDYTTELSKLDSHRTTAINKENQRHAASIQDGQTIHNANQDARTETANFWGGLFSGIVGACVCLAFICISVVEIYNRGAGVQLEHKQVDAPTPLVTLFLSGLLARVDNFFRSRIETFYQLAPTPTPTNYKQIGFSTPINSAGTIRHNRVTGTIPTATMPTATHGDDSGAYDHRMGTIGSGTIGNPGTTKKGDDRQKVIVVEKEKLRTCEHCQDEYKYKSSKQKFCSTKCRKDAWRKANGRDPFLKKKS